jgi:hypothetical protein
VFIKSSNGHASLFHHIGHTNPVEAEFAEPSCRDFQNLGVSVTRRPPEVSRYKVKTL